MATRHAAPGEVVDLATWGDELPGIHSKTIAKHRPLELARIVLRAGETWSEHRVSGPITIQCLRGRIQCSALGRDRVLTAGQLIYLDGGEPHALYAETNADVLLTIVLV